MSLRSSSPPLIGTVLIDRYRLVHALPFSGPADAFLAADLKLQQRCVVLLFLVPVAPDLPATLASLQIPGSRERYVPQIYDYGPWTGGAFLVLEQPTGHPREVEATLEEAVSRLAGARGGGVMSGMLSGASSLEVYACAPTVRSEGPRQSVVLDQAGDIGDSWAPPPPPSAVPAVPDAIDDAFARLDRGWLGVDAPRRMTVNQTVKLSAVAIRDLMGQKRVEAAMEHQGPRIEETPLGRLVRLELIPDRSEEFTVVPLSEIEQPVLRSDLTRWEWSVTPHIPGAARTLRLRATNCVDVAGSQLRKSHPVRTVLIDVLVSAADPELPPALPTPALRKILEDVLPTDAEAESFILDYFPAVYRQLGGGMGTMQKLTVLLSQAPGDEILHRLRDAYPDEVARSLGHKTAAPPVTPRTLIPTLPAVPLLADIPPSPPEPTPPRPPPGLFDDPRSLGALIGACISLLLCLLAALIYWARR